MEAGNKSIVKWFKANHRGIYYYDNKYVTFDSNKSILTIDDYYDQWKSEVKFNSIIVKKFIESKL